MIDAIAQQIPPTANINTYGTPNPPFIVNPNMRYITVEISMIHAHMELFNLFFL